MHRARFPTGAVAALAAAAAGLAGLAAGACASSDGYAVITVDARPAVHDARSLTVSLTNAGTTRMDSLPLREQPFPVTFSISAPGRTGDLSIAIDAIDAAGLVVGHGSAATTVEANAAGVMLESTDFVVNTDYAGDQYPSSDFEAVGFQVAALPDGTWTTAYRDSCPSSSCSLYARRFDKLGRPVQTQAAAGTNAFPLTVRPTTSASTPAIAAGATTTIAVWDFYDVSGTATGVACRTLDTGGRAGPDQISLATESADVVAVAAVAGDAFVASWTALVSPAAIHAVFIKPDCTAATSVLTVSTLTGTVHRSSVASAGDRVLFAWITDGSLHTRIASTAGVFSTADTVLVPATATEQVEHARVVPASGGGFVIAVRWAQKTTADGPGRIELYRVTATGALAGPATLVTDRSGSDFDNSESFAAVRRSDGTVLIAWHTCGPLGDDSMCGVFGRTMRDTGEAISNVFTIPTTTLGDQKRPSVAALPDAFVAVWADASAKPPDVAGQSVRARIFYPTAPGPTAPAPTAPAPTAPAAP